MTKKTRYFLTGSAAVLAGGLCTGLVAYYSGGFQAVVASTGPTELNYVPLQSKVVGYANVRDIMDSQLRQRFKQSVPMPMGEDAQRDFLEATGIDLENDIDYVVAAASAVPGSGHGHPTGVVIARGRFDIVRLEGLAREHGAQVEEYKGKRLLTLRHGSSNEELPVSGAPTTVEGVRNTGVLAFLEPGLVGIGDLASVKEAIDAQLSAQSITSNDEMMELVRDIAQSNNAWAVGRFDLIASQAKLPDEIARRMPPVKWLAVAGHVNGGISANLRAEANDEQAAENLRGVLNGVVSLARLQGQNDPKLASLIQSLQLTGEGKTVRLSFALPAELFELMQPKAPAIQ